MTVFTDAVSSTAYDLAVLMRDCAAAKILAEGLPTPDRSVVTVGEIAWDDCPCGQLAVTLVEIFPADSPPNPALTLWARCPPKALVAHYIAEILRCAHATTGTGTPPTPIELAVDALLAVKDAWAVRQGVGCCLKTQATNRNIVDYVIGGQKMAGPAGGCVGSDLDVYVVLPLCPCGGG